MKTLKYIILAAIVVFVYSCKNEGEIVIDSLQIFGDEFYYGETVNVGMAVSTPDPDNTTFYWECDGGSFLQRQGYTLNQWKAPDKAGVYKIKCTVECNGKKVTREADLLVSGFFFQRFDSPDANTLPNGWSQSNSATQTRGKRMELQVTTSGQHHGEIRYNMNKSELYPPYSTKADVGIVGSVSNVNDPKYPNSSTATSGTFASRYPTQDNYSAIHITGNTPSTTAAPTHFINEMRVEFYPEADHVQPFYKYLKVGGESGSPLDSITIAESEFDAIFRFQYTRRANVSEGILQQQVWYAIPFKASSLVFGAEKPVSFGVSVSEDYIVTVTANDAVIFTTNEVKNWRETKGGNAVLAAKEFKFSYPSHTRMFLDNVFFWLDSNFGKQ